MSLAGLRLPESQIATLGELRRILSWRPFELQLLARSRIGNQNNLSAILVYEHRRQNVVAPACFLTGTGNINELPDLACNIISRLAAIHLIAPLCGAIIVNVKNIMRQGCTGKSK